MGIISELIKISLQWCVCNMEILVLSEKNLIWNWTIFLGIFHFLLVIFLWKFSLKRIIYCQTMLLVAKFSVRSQNLPNYWKTGTLKWYWTHTVSKFNSVSEKFASRMYRYKKTFNQLFVPTELFSEKPTILCSNIIWVS